MRLLLFILLTGCASTKIVVVPVTDPYVKAYVSGRSNRAPEKVDARVQDVSRRLGEHVELVDRSAFVWRHRLRTIDTYSGVTKVSTRSKDLGEVRAGEYRKVAVVYRSADRPPPLDTLWTARQAAIDRACPDVRSTLACIRVRGTVRTSVSGSSDADRPALCAAGLGSSCMLLGWDAKYAGDVEGFVNWMRQACETHDWPEACAALGSRAARLPEDVAARYRQRAEMLDRAQCEAGRIDDCPDEDANRQQRCDRGELEHCRDLARRALRTATGPQRTACLDELATYCDQGMAIACFDLANALDGPRASQLAARACLLGSRGGCELLDR